MLNVRFNQTYECQNEDLESPQLPAYTQGHRRGRMKIRRSVSGHKSLTDAAVLGFGGGSLEHWASGLALFVAIIRRIRNLLDIGGEYRGFEDLYSPICAKTKKRS